MARKIASPTSNNVMPVDTQVIDVVGARENNLNNINISIPKNKLVVFTGVSGSGKSSLAFDTIFHEGQRRYMESFSAYARQFIGNMERPDVDRITGLSPVISIEQKTTNKNPRSTVGTVTEIYDFMRLLYARAANAYSYNTGKIMVKFSEEEIVENIREKFEDKKVVLLAPIIRGRKGHYRELFEDFLKKGYLKVRVDGEVKDITPKMQLDRYVIHDIELVIDRLAVTEDMRIRLSQSIQKTLQMGKGLMQVLDYDTNQVTQYSKSLMCNETGISYDEPSPNTFSFNSPYGACPVCKGLGTVYTINRDAMIPDSSKTVAEGGIVPLGEERDAWIYRQIAAIARRQKINLKKPINEIPEDFIHFILYAHTPKDQIAEANMVVTDFDTLGTANDSEKSAYDNAEFEGIVHLVKRWFNTSSSEAIRNWAEEFFSVESCASCQGARLKKESLWFKVADKNIAELSHMDLDELAVFINNVNGKLSAKQQAIAKDILKEISDRLSFLLNVGLNYLSLNRPSKTLSGGESQRIRLATQIGSQLEGITYILDEPSIGLHQRDNQRLIDALLNLRDIGNTVLVVEHDKDIMLAADYIIDIGPRAGKHGGNIVAAGTPQEFLKTNTETSKFLNGNRTIEVPKVRRSGTGQFIELKGVTGHTLKNVSARFPLGCLTVVTGVSGSGKSTLINDTLYPILSNHAFKASKMKPMPYAGIEGLQFVDKVIEIDQSPIGRTPRSNPATYCGFFTEIRTMFASVPEAKIRGYKPGRFSFNVKGGRCEVCEGGGMRTIEMNFLPDVYVPCEKCQGKRYNRETLEIRYKGKSISDVLDMTVDEAVEFFHAVPWLHRRIKSLQDVGLGYISLGQSATTLSGGEAQRVKLATELGKKETGKTFYILDEPTTGLHFSDVKQLLDVIQKLVDRGNTVLVIEHNLDVIKVADYIIDLGPEGGKGGGQILFQGVPEDLVKIKESRTAPFVEAELKA
ncbi:excinuclease ABC subunit UvrA [Polluticaenibacter yanchengensis]|uniref:UvrABC system protein A n=1 Tax=Polluticaenibacter yanchengensis TaxID=3014562 RepID=A0ABT4UMD8_9BACT|nr:excinuclease ABC subunit UvrA [Chitinophagaceae bacterium LY-5]